MTASTDTAPALPRPHELTWRKSGNAYYAEDRDLGMAARVGRIGGTRWFIEVWPEALAPCPARLVRTEAGLRTMAEARAMALRTPCFRCGRGRPLITMERHSPRWRCLNHEECEAERDRLLNGSSWDPLDAAAFQARTGAGNAEAAAWATEYRKASVRLFRVRNTRGLSPQDSAAAAAEADMVTGRTPPGPLRRAWVTVTARQDPEVVSGVLPPNYQVRRTEPGRVLIEGHDLPGSTLDLGVRRALARNHLSFLEVL